MIQKNNFILLFGAIFSIIACNKYQKEIDIYNAHKDEAYVCWLADVIQLLDEKKLSPQEYLESLDLSRIDTCYALSAMVHVIQQEYRFIELAQHIASLRYSFTLMPAQSDIDYLKKLIRVCRPRCAETATHEKIYDRAQNIITIITSAKDSGDAADLEYKFFARPQPALTQPTVKPAPADPKPVEPAPKVEQKPVLQEYYGGDNAFAPDSWVY